MKRVFIVHGWDGYPTEGWFPWLKAELEKRGFTVAVPAMPHPERPTVGLGRSHHRSRRATRRTNLFCRAQHRRDCDSKVFGDVAGSCARGRFSLGGWIFKIR